MTDAWAQVAGWLSCPGVFVPGPADRHAEIVGGLVAAGGLRSNDVPDAHIAAIAIEHGLTLCSADSGYGRFPALTWRNPLV